MNSVAATRIATPKNWRCYATALGGPGTELKDVEGGEYAWNILPLRLQTYQQILASGRRPLNLSPSLWRGFLLTELECQERTVAVLDELRDAIKPENSFREMVNRREVTAYRVLEWLTWKGETKQELCVPVLLTNEGEQNHVIYIGFSITADGDAVRTRISDARPSPWTMNQPTLEPSGRLKTSSLELMFPRNVLRTRAIRRLMKKMWLSPAGDTQAFYRTLTRVMLSKPLARRGLRRVSPMLQTRPMSVQTGSVCYLKNHSRAVAARLHDALCNGQASLRAATVTEAKEAWHWLKEEERRIAAEFSAENGR